MGEVYKAWDTRLQRDVAIKIVDTSRPDNESGSRRFEQEARSASSLNHPNVVTIHDTGREDHVLYIVTELVEGEPLRMHLQRSGPLPMREVLDLGIQIAEGLAAAHDHGIVHRDLKPENIMITPEGRVKIVDFGLAKPDEDSYAGELRPDDNETAPGLLVGTTAYMSPEQARGARVRPFGDQFSLGVILYEMVSGMQPFRRQTPLQTLSAILSEEAPDLAYGSAPFQWLVKRCLHKDPDHRYASTQDLARELRNIRDHLTGSQELQAPLPQSRNRAWLRPLLWTAAVVLAGVTGFLAASQYEPSTEWRHAQFIPFATSEGIEVFPSWSPNGKSLAYSAEVNGTFQILIRSNGSSMPAQLTNSAEDCFQAIWSPDGVRVYYISGHALWSVGATGGTPERVLDNVAHAAIAPDGRTIAALRKENESYGVWVGLLPGDKLTRVDKGQLGARQALPWSYLRFSPDGKRIGAWLSLNDGRSEFWSIPADGGDPERRFANLENLPLAREFDWSHSGDEVVYAERTALSFGSHLWRAGFDWRRPLRITNGAGSELSPAVSANGRRIAFSSAEIDYDLFRIHLDGRMEKVLSTPRLETYPALSSQGQFIWVTDRSGQPEIWVKEGSWERPLVPGNSFGEDLTTFISGAVFSPDAKRIAYGRAGANDESIWISTTNGDPPVRLAKEPGSTIQRGPTWSPDGNSIAYVSIRKGKQALVRTRAGSLDPPEVIAEGAALRPQWSPKGDWIAVAKEHGLAVISPEEGVRKEIGSGRWLVHGWSASGSLLYGLRATQYRRLQLVSLKPQDGRETVLADMGPVPAACSYGAAIGSPPFRGFALAEDGRSFLTSLISARSDIWIMEASR